MIFQKFIYEFFNAKALWLLLKAFPRNIYDIYGQLHDNKCGTHAFCFRAERFYYSTLAYLYLICVKSMHPAPTQLSPPCL